MPLGGQKSRFLESFRFQKLVVISERLRREEEQGVALWSLWFDLEFLATSKVVILN